MADLTQKEYLGKGFELPFRFAASGGVAQASYEQKVKLNIFTVLSTEPGTRLFESDFGCPLRAYMFEPDDFITFTGIKSAITDALTRWVPVVEIVSIDVSTDKRENNFVPIVLKYQISGVNSEFNLVYPFYHPEAQ